MSEDIYHVYNGVEQPLPETSQKGNGALLGLSSLLSKLSKILGILGIALLLYAFYPTALNLLSSFKLSQNEVQLLSAQQGAMDTYEPAFDPKLPKTNSLTITSIGVKTNIQEATYDNYEEALRHGVWRVSDFGAPTQRGVPTILAAHRFGYLAWSNKFRRENSFYNLPKLKVGDTVEVVWRQRKYVYEIYAEEKGEEITDYTADLILYTCEKLAGPERVFKYARLLRI